MNNKNNKIIFLQISLPTKEKRAKLAFCKALLPVSGQGKLNAYWVCLMSVNEFLRNRKGTQKQLNADHLLVSCYAFVKFLLYISLDTTWFNNNYI